MSYSDWTDDVDTLPQPPEPAPTQALKRPARPAPLPPAPVTEDPNLPPHSDSAEETVIGSILKWGASIALVATYLTPEHFFSLRYRVIYASALRLFEAGVAIDLGTLLEDLKANGDEARVGGILGLSEIDAAVPSASHIEHYANEVVHLATRRRLVSAAATIAAEAYDTRGETLTPETSMALLQKAQSHLAAAAGDAYAKRILLPHEWVGKYYEHVENVGGDNGSLGVSTGFMTFDRLWLGLQPGLIIVAGRPGTGKSEVTWNIATHVGLSRRAPNTTCEAAKGWVLFFSIEMDETELAERAVAGNSGVKKEALIYGRFSPTDATHIEDTMEMLEASRIALVVEAGITSTDVRAMALQHAAKHGPIDLIVVDYLQLLADRHGKERNSNYDIGIAAKNLKNLSKEMGCAVIAAAQLSRGVDQRPVGSRIPVLSDLRDSGEIENHANIVTMVYRGDLAGEDGWVPDTTLMHNRKHRRWGALRERSAKMIYAQGAYRDYESQH